MTRNGHGGRRPGAGRPPLRAGAASVVLQVRLTPEQRRAVRERGGSGWARGVLANRLSAASLPPGATPLSRGPSRHPLPLGFSGVQAGFPSPAENYREQAIDLNELLVRNEPATFLLRARGSSMNLAGIADGDLLIVDRSLSPHPGDIVVMRVNDGFTVKRLTRDDQGLCLRPESDQPGYAELRPGEGDEWSCFGVVTHIVKDSCRRLGTGPRP